MVLFLQLLTVALCGGFLVVVVRDWAATNRELVRNDQLSLRTLIRREADWAATYPEGYVSKHHRAAKAARFLLRRADARLEHVKRWGF